jgi:hypothetical protein
MEMYVASEFDPMGHSVASEALEAMFQLLKAAEDDEALMQLSGELGRRTFSHLTHVAEALRQADATLKVDWVDYAGTQHAWSSSETATERILSYFSKTSETRSEMKAFEGRLVGASLMKNRFELLLLDRRTIEGKFIATLGPTIARSFGQLCHATVDETEFHDKATGENRIYYSLVALVPASGNMPRRD